MLVVAQLVQVLNDMFDFLSKYRLYMRYMRINVLHICAKACLLRSDDNGEDCRKGWVWVLSQ